MTNTKYLLLLFLFFVSCKSHSQIDPILSTTDKVLESLKTNNFPVFRSMFDKDLSFMGKDESMLAEQFYQSSHYYNYYDKNAKPIPQISNDIDPLGRKKVSVIIFKGQDSANNIQEFEVDLFFGPPNLFPLEKLSDFKVVLIKLKEDTLLQPLNNH